MFQEVKKHGGRLLTRHLFRWETNLVECFGAQGRTCSHIKLLTLAVTRLLITATVRSADVNDELRRYNATMSKVHCVNNAHWFHSCQWKY